MSAKAPADPVILYVRQGSCFQPARLLVLLFPSCYPVGGDRSSLSQRLCTEVKGRVAKNRHTGAVRTSADVFSSYPCLRTKVSTFEPWAERALEGSGALKLSLDPSPISLNPQTLLSHVLPYPKRGPGQQTPLISLVSTGPILAFSAALLDGKSAHNLHTPMV